MPDVMSKADEAGTETSAKSQGGEQSTKRAGTRVFKKSTPNGKLTVYIGKRDFYDHIEHVDPIDGVVLVDPEHVKDRIVYCHVLAAFRYGREDLDVLGLTFRKDLFLARQQVYPAKSEDDQPLTRLQERLLKKLGKNSYPFKFQERQTVLNGITVKTKKKLPKGAPSSVTLQPAPGDTGKPCGVDYELKVYLSDTQDEKEYKRNSVRLAIRKITYAPPVPAPQPMIEAHKEFMMCPHPLFIEASLDKGMYYHGESISVNVHISNRSNKTVKRIKITVRQYADICLFSTAQYKCPIACLESEAPGFITLNSTKRFQKNSDVFMSSRMFLVPLNISDIQQCLSSHLNGIYCFSTFLLDPGFTDDKIKDGFPVGSSGTLSKVYVVTPLLKNNKDKRGLALDGQLKHEDTCLASSTTTDSSIPKENLGIIVHYKVKIRLIVALGSDLSVELPFMLTHPKPPDDVSPSTSPSPMPRRLSDVRGGENEPPIDSDLITFDTSGPEKSPGNDDLIFEEFARMRVRGEHQGETNA